MCFLSNANAGGWKKTVSTKIDNVVWVIKGMCGINATKGFHAGEKGNKCSFNGEERWGQVLQFNMTYNSQREKPHKND